MTTNVSMTPFWGACGLPGNGRKRSVTTITRPFGLKPMSAAIPAAPGIESDCEEPGIFVSWPLFEKLKPKMFPLSSFTTYSR